MARLTNEQLHDELIAIKSDVKEILFPILQKNDYLMIKGSNATGLNNFSKNIIKGI